MYLSTLFLIKIEKGVIHAISKCNEEFLKRFGAVKDYIPVFFDLDSSGKVLGINNEGNELMALWDVFKDFKNDIAQIDLPVIRAMDLIHTVRNELA